MPFSVTAMSSLHRFSNLTAPILHRFLHKRVLLRCLDTPTFFSTTFTKRTTSFMHSSHRAHTFKCRCDVITSHRLSATSFSFLVERQSFPTVGSSLKFASRGVESVLYGITLIGRREEWRDRLNIFLSTGQDRWRSQISVFPVVAMT